MLNSEQITQLNQKIRQEQASGNPMVTLIRAAKQAEIPFKDVLEYAIIRTLQDARTDNGDLVNGPSPLAS